MAWTKVVTESSSGNIAQKSATAGVADSITSQGALATLNSVAAGQIDANAVEASEIASGAVGYEELASNSVITAKIKDDNVTTAKIAGSNITNALMADDAIGVAELSTTGTAGTTTFLRGDMQWVVPTDISTVANLTDTTITGTPANNEVLAYDSGASKWTNQTHSEAGIQVEFAEGEISSNLIEQGAITLAQMANLSANTFIGRDTESTGAPEALSVSAVKTMLSLNNVANTTDAGKPVSTAQQAEIDTKAELAGAVGQIFSATTAITGSNTNQVATTAFVFTEAATKAELAGDGTQDFSAQNLSVTGNLSITGTSEIRNTTTETINVADNTIVLNSDKSSTADVDAGIVVERGGDGNNKSIYWDEGDDKWKFGDSASAVVAGTYQGDVASVEVNSSYESGAVVPVGHFQWDGTNLYVRSL